MHVPCSLTFKPFKSLGVLRLLLVGSRGCAATRLYGSTVLIVYVRGCSCTYSKPMGVSNGQKPGNQKTPSSLRESISLGTKTIIWTKSMPLEVRWVRQWRHTRRSRPGVGQALQKNARKSGGRVQWGKANGKMVGDLKSAT